MPVPPWQYSCSSSYRSLWNSWELLFAEAVTIREHQLPFGEPHDRGLLAKPALCSKNPVQESGLRVDGGTYADYRHWRQHCHLHSGELGSVASYALPRAGTA